MNREDIIRMAREAQMPFYWRTGEITYLDKLERFAALVASAEHKRVQQVYTDAATDSVKAAIAYEREACALRAEEFLTEPEPDWDGDFWNQAIERVALAIRARGQA